MFVRVSCALLLVALAAGAACSRGPRHLRLATTTSARDSGLLGALLPVYERRTGVRVDVIAVGTGAAFKLAADGNADLLLVHDPEGEKQFIASGHALERRPLCWNTFEILGPVADPARVKAATSAGEALRKIAETASAFVSRGDDSGTHRRERSLWSAAGGLASWPGYRETGQAMGATLLVADELNAYVLADRGTALSFRRKLRLVLLLSGTAELRNVYSVVVLDAKRHPQIAADAADDLAGWLAGTEASEIIAAFRAGGEALFHPIRNGQ